MKKILITGGAGFVGSQLGYRLWSKGYSVHLLDNFSFGHLDNLIVNNQTFGTLAVADIRDQNLQALFEGVDTVFHLAGIAALPVCQADPQLAYSVNTAAVGNVLEVARRANVRRVVFSSTSAVYENSKEQALREDDVVAPDLVYSMSKHSGENVCRAYSQNYGMDIVVCRFFNVYGPHQDFKRASPPFTSYIARELTANRTPVLFNQSLSRRDYIYSDDVIDLLTRMMDSENHFRSDIFNVGSGASYSVAEIYEAMKKVSGKEIIPSFRESKSFWDSYGTLFSGTMPFSKARVQKEVDKSSKADIAKATAEFGWRPATTIEAGLKKVYEYAASKS